MPVLFLSFQMSLVFRYTYFLALLVMTALIQPKLKTSPQLFGVLFCSIVLALQQFDSNDLNPLKKASFRLLLTLFNFVSVVQLLEIIHSYNAENKYITINGTAHPMMDTSIFLFIFIAALSAPLITLIYNRRFTYDETVEKRFTLVMTIVASSIFLVKTFT